MSKMISVASGFQYSVNIGYDLNSEDKLKNFIPTKAALSLLKDILLSTNPTSHERARILIGAYGKGKSHIVLMILSMLMKRDLSLFEQTLPKIKEDEKLYQWVKNYYESEDKIFPVVISGSNTSLPQAFLMALQRTLAENEMLDIMPETNYKAAVAVIERWKNDFPDTYQQLQKAINEPVVKFVEKLNDYSVTAYEKFERVYPTLTAGSSFNPFLGFDVVELYESAAKGLKKKGYTGIYVIYDEFSKFLEANISEASVSDMKMLQDFAEKCNRSGACQMHLMLISHKEISNYIDKLPKQKVDGWRGVSERFTHIHLNNNFTQTYELIASVIQKDEKVWKGFCFRNTTQFKSLLQRYSSHPVFAEVQEEEMHQVVYSCYPLHPISTFILPRLSERVAQNERTLFTFLSANGISTLPEFLEKYEDDAFEVITPDWIYDYFEPLFQKEVYSEGLHSIYQLTKAILSKVNKDSLESKIVKTIALIYILEQFEKLKPTKEELVGIFSISYTVSAIEQAIANLIEKEYVIYLKRSNDYLRLKQTSGVNIPKTIQNEVAAQIGKVSVKATLNDSNYDNYVYPSRYNDDREMTRYFSFQFIDEDEIEEDTNWDIKSESVEADGVIYAVIPKEDFSIEELKKRVLRSSEGFNRYVFIVPKNYTEINAIVQEFNAVKRLRDRSADDALLFEEYEVIYEDLHDIISSFINGYTHPEGFKSVYVHMGQECEIVRKAALTGLLSDICDEVFSMTPIINNEAINKNEITSIANNSRTKIIAGLLRNELELGLGLSGTGQEVSMMRSTLIRTKVLVEENNHLRIDLEPGDELLNNMFDNVIDFIMQAHESGSVSFADLYWRLTAPENHIGMRKGLIPIYVAAVFHEYKQRIVIQNRFGQMPLNVDTLLQINADPENFELAFLDWDSEKEKFVQQLAQVFQENVIDAEKAINSYDYVVAAMRRWYMSLPKYTKEMKKTACGERVDRRYIEFMRLLKQNVGSHELLFRKMPEIFGYAEQFNAGLSENIAAAKNYYDEALHELKLALIQQVKEIFVLSKNEYTLEQASLYSVITDWCDSQDIKVFDQLFPDGTEKCLGLFKTITHDEETFIARLAKAVTDLRLEDWDTVTISSFAERLKRYKKTAEEYHSEQQAEVATITNSYQITFTDEAGAAITKRFDRVEYSKRGRLLLNAVTAEIDAMGHSISEQEKRQVLMEVLKKLC